MQKKFKRPRLDTRTSVILWANWFQFAAGERALNPHVLSRMLLWCQEGKGRVRVNGVWHNLNPDDFLFLPCNTKSSTSPIRASRSGSPESISFPIIHSIAN